jgi:outer membrane PBP1 activator LpoA protein
MTNLKRLAMIALFAILATACSTQKPLTGPGTGAVAPKTASQDIKNLLAQAQTADPIKAAQLKLQAAKLMVLQKRYNETLELLNAIETGSLPDTLKFKLALVKGNAALGLKDGFSAIKYLTKTPADSSFNNAQLSEKHQLLASAYGLTNQLDQEVSSLVTASQYLNNGDEIIELNEKVWLLFKTLDIGQLQKLNSKTDNSYTMRGWLDLMIKFREIPNSEKMLANEWHKRWGAHVAARFQPQELAQYLIKEPLHNTSFAYGHVVVALPKSGRYAKGASAILKGIQYAANKTGGVQVSYIDSMQYNSAAAILEKATEMNADAIIGPIDRQLVSQFAQMNALPMPVLALNSTSISNSNLYQFSLGNEDEARDAAVRAYRDGRRSMLALVPENDQGNLAASTFINQFNSLGGQVLSTTYYDTNEGNVTNAIASMLGINQGAIRSLQKKVKTAHLRGAIRRMTRKDADGIFLFSNASDAFQIGPSILYFYADNIPLYATSKIYRGKPNADKDIDLNGMMFGDLPWVLAPSANKQALAAAGAQTRLGRLYAFGMDALNVTPELYNLATQPESSLSGETGKLSVSAENLVQKTLTWAKFVNGSPEILPAN